MAGLMSLMTTAVLHIDAEVPAIHQNPTNVRAKAQRRKEGLNLFV